MSNTKKQSKNTKRQSTKITVDALNKQSREIDKLEEKKNELANLIIEKRNKLYADSIDMYNEKYKDKWLMINGTSVYGTNTEEPTFEDYRIVLCKYIHPSYDYIRVGIYRGIGIEHGDGDDFNILCLSEENLHVHYEKCIKVLTNNEVLDILNKIDLKISNFIGATILKAKPDTVSLARKKRR